MFSMLCIIVCVFYALYECVCFLCFVFVCVFSMFCISVCVFYVLYECVCFLCFV